MLGINIKDKSNILPFIYKIYVIEKNISIEKPEISQYFKDAGFVYKTPLDDSDIHDESTVLGNKYKLAKQICDNTTVIDLKEKPVEKDKSKSTERKPKKIHKQSNKSAVASLQKKALKG